MRKGIKVEVLEEGEVTGGRIGRVNAKFSKVKVCVFREKVMVRKYLRCALNFPRLLLWPKQI